jgi:hypothetical protein
MCQSLRKVPENLREDTIIRRLASNTRGLGYWAAVDALKHMKPDHIERIMAASGLLHKHMGRR